MERNKVYDNIKGFLIFLVVFGHILLPFDNTKIIFIIYFFHMPLFMIISGYFTQNGKNNKLSRLLLYFLIMNISFILYDYIVYHNLELFKILYSSWYVLLLFFYRLIYGKINEFIIRHKYFIWFILLVLGIAIGFLNTDLFILRFFEYLFFFHTGYIFNNKITMSKHKSIGILLGCIIGIIFIVSLPLDIEFYLGSTYEIGFFWIFRLLVYLIDIMLFNTIIKLIPNKDIFMLSRFGRESLSIYIYHRIPVLIITDFIINENTSIFINIAIAVVLCLLFSSSIFRKITNYLITFIEKKKVYFIIILVILTLLIVIVQKEKYSINNIGPIEQEMIDKSISIGFVGDLILLENQVKDSYYNDKYDFDYMFEYTKDLFDNTSYTIGVLEGPIDNKQDYSIGNYDDDKELRLNYPSSFIDSIKKAGIDMVTIANNHIYDRGYSSAIETTNNLNNHGLNYVGDTNHQYQIIDVEGIKIGMVAYTYGTNYPNDTNNSDIVKILDKISKTSKSKEQQEMVKNDIKYLKDNSDIVIVLPHYGTEFNYDFDDYQKEWNNLFVKAGADIIFGDHSHVIGPIEFNSGKVLLASPGNYVNSYTGHDSDLSMYVKVYIDKSTKKITFASVIPLLAQKEEKGYYPIPFYDLNTKNKNNKRLVEVKKIFGEVLFDNSNIRLSQEYFKGEKNNYYSNDFILTTSDKNSIIYQTIDKNQNICFIGDSITEGTINDYHPWYEPLTTYFNNKNFINISRGSFTSKDVLDTFKEKIKESSCNATIINIGTNDIRYNITDENEYIENIQEIINLLPEDSKIILLSPWKTYSGDKNLVDNKNNKIKLYEKYNKKLKMLEDSNRLFYLNPNNYINEYVSNNQNNYLIDGVHPSKDLGIKLYSFATMRSSE